MGYSGMTYCQILFFHLTGLMQWSQHSLHCIFCVNFLCWQSPWGKETFIHLAHGKPQHVQCDNSFLCKLMAWTCSTSPHDWGLGPGRGMGSNACGCHQFHPLKGYQAILPCPLPVLPCLSLTPTPFGWENQHPFLLLNIVVWAGTIWLPALPLLGSHPKCSSLFTRTQSIEKEASSSSATPHPSSSCQNMMGHKQKKP